MLEADIAIRALKIQDSNIPEHFTAYQKGIYGYFPFNPNRTQEEIEAFKVGLDLWFTRKHIGEFVTADEVMGDMSFQIGFFQRFNAPAYPPGQKHLSQLTSNENHDAHLASMKSYEQNVDRGSAKSKEHYYSYISGALLALRVLQKTYDRSAANYTVNAEAHERAGQSAIEERKLCAFYTRSSDDVSTEIEDLEERRKKLGILTPEERRRLDFLAWEIQNEKRA